MMSRNLVSFFVGLLFAIGLGLSGMTNPQNVVCFLDVVGKWNPSLLFVMVGAIGVHFVFYKFIMRRKAPILDLRFHLPTGKPIDPRLLSGAVIFGIGWGLAGYCPGPAITALAGFSFSSVLFVASMIAGMVLVRLTKLQKAQNL